MVSELGLAEPGDSADSHMNVEPSSSSSLQPRSIHNDHDRGWYEWYARLPVYIVVLCSNAVFQGMIVNGFISTSISSIEKRFNLSSTHSGIFSATYDFAVAIMLFPLAIYSRRVNKSLVVGAGMVVVGLGALCIALPHFIEGNYSVRAICSFAKTGLDTLVGDLQLEHCHPNRENSCVEQPVSSIAYPILLFSQILVGCGAAPLFTYGTSSLDEFDSHANTGRNMAILMGVGTLGPAIGFIGGGFMLNVWGDIGKSDYHELGIEGTKDPRWYGAWWMGFVIAGACCILCAIPMMFFPRKLLDTDERKKNDVALTHSDLDVDYSGQKSEFFKTFKLFLFNPTCMSLVLTQTFESFLMNGYITFIPKLFEQLFGYSSSWAATATGLVVVPMGITGSFIGSRLASANHNKFKRMLKKSMILNMLVIGCSGVLFLRCGDRLIGGVVGREIRCSLSNATAPGKCSKECECDRIFNPVCDRSSGVSYLSPCHAGCAKPLTERFVGATEWELCECPASKRVSKGWCVLDCVPIQIAFFAIFSVMVALIFASGPILQNAGLRVVSFDHRDPYICFGWLFVRVFGSIPGAVVFGMVIDTACLEWTSNCEGSQKCVVYDTSTLVIFVFLFTITAKSLVICSLLAASRTYTPVKGADDEDDNVTCDSEKSPIAHPLSALSPSEQPNVPMDILN